MSLELKIENLTTAIEALTAVMNLHSAPTITVDPVSTPVENPAFVEPVVELVVDEISIDVLKALCLKTARSTPNAKDQVKALLAKFDATTVKELAIGDRCKVMALLESGKY